MHNFDETDKYELKEILNDSLAKEIETFCNTLHSFFTAL